MSNELKNNPNIFYHKHEEEDGEIIEIVIDFKDIMSLACVHNEDDESVELVIKGVKSTKAEFGFLNEEPLNRFKKEYAAYVSSRSEIVNVAVSMAKDIADSMRDTLAEEAKSMAMSMVEELRNQMTQEVEDFKLEITKQAKRITDTALSHQKDINAENDHYLKSMADNNQTLLESIEVASGLGAKLDRIINVVEIVAPSSKSIRDAEARETEELSKEVAE